MVTFKHALTTVVAPRLPELGYQFETFQRTQNPIYGFWKPLGNDIYAILEFRRRGCDRPAQETAFSVDLFRCKLPNIAEWRHRDGSYEGALGAELGAVLWYVFRVRTYDTPQHWWVPNTPADYPRVLAEVLTQLERYGLPWLEDPKTTQPLVIPDRELRTQEFTTQVLSIVAPGLFPFGYEAHEHEAGPIYLSKHLQDGSYALILFQFRLIPDSEPPRYAVSLRLMRNQRNDPFGNPSGNGLDTTLSKLLWHVYGLRIYPSELWEWEYSNPQRLVEQLTNLLQHLKQYAIPWLEGSQFRNPARTDA